MWSIHKSLIKNIEENKTVPVPSSGTPAAVPDSREFAELSVAGAIFLTDLPKLEENEYFEMVVGVRNSKNNRNRNRNRSIRSIKCMNLLGQVNLKTTLYLPSRRLIKLPATEAMRGDRIGGS